MVAKSGATDSGAWYAKPACQALSAFETRAEGLSESQALERAERYGANELPQPAKRPAWLRLLLQFHNVLIYVLIGAAVLTAFLGEWINTGVIAAVVIINAVIGFLQEGRAEEAMDAIRGMLAPEATVIRDGLRRTVAAREVMPGDIVALEAGDKVPADLRLIEAKGLKIQEAILTGESVPIEKSIEPVEENAPLGDRTSMVFSGTLVAAGQAKGVTVSTGHSTEIGRISGLLTRVQDLTTPLVAQMAIFAKWLTALILLIAILLILYGVFIQHRDFTDLLMAVVGLSVAAIPEGLPAVLTVTLAIGVQAMARREAIIRRLPAIETLGAVSVICTDKTGTLTRNEMMVASVVTPEADYRLDGTGYDPSGDVYLEGQPVDPKERADLQVLARAAQLCNDARLFREADLWTISGDPMEGALLSMSRKLGLRAGDEQEAWCRDDTVPFDAEHRFMAVLVHSDDGQREIFVKGAPEKILAMCTAERTGDGAHTPIDGERWQARAGAIADNGERVLALAHRVAESSKTDLSVTDVQGELIFLGLVGLMDPPRREAIEAVAVCRNAGIRVKMITGDHARTAAAIGRQIGLENTATVLTGVDLEDMSDADLVNAVTHVDIFARTSPEHKLRLVTALQADANVVAMTGDGVNDAPALKRADIGIAMGRRGSEAAKEAADFVLADDNFASIAAAVREGRTVYDNLKKVIGWTLPTSFGEAAVIIAALLFGLIMPVTPVQILWVNLVTVATLGLALAFEPSEDGTMLRRPRRRGEPLLGGILAWHIGLVSTIFLIVVFAIFTYALDQGYAIERARTMAVNALVVMEIFNLFFVRRLYSTSFSRDAVMGTRAVWIAVLIIIPLQLAMTYMPFMQAVFATAPLTVKDGAIVLGGGVLLLTVLELEKQIRLSWKRLVPIHLKTGPQDTRRSVPGAGRP